jgi:hypothetical protein
VHRSVDGNDGLASAGSARNSSRSGEAAFHKISLIRMKENDPLFPRGSQRQCEPIAILDGVKAAQRVRMRQRVGPKGPDYRFPWRCAEAVIHQCLASFLREVLADIHQLVFVVD